MTLREGRGIILSWEHCIRRRKTFAPNVPRFPKQQCLLYSSQPSPACPSAKATFISGPLAEKDAEFGYPRRRVELLCMLVATCFGSNLQSSGSFWIRLNYVKIQIEMVVYLKYITDEKRCAEQFVNDVITHEVQELKCH
jgi:hypothetical protein